MNLIGKIFVVLIFFMSVAFMAFAVMVYGAHENWRDKIVATGGLNEQLATAKKKNEELTAEANRRATEVAALRTADLQARAKLESENKILEEQRNQALADNEQKTKALAEATVAFKRAQDNLTALREEVEGLRAEIRTAQTDANKSFVDATEKTNKLNEAINNLDILKDREAELVQQITELRDKIARGAVPGAAREVDGVVTQLGNNDLVELSIGSDDGLEVGHQLDVHRGARYLGRVRVVRVSSDKAISSVIKSYEQGPIQRGDRVSTVRES